MPWLFCVAELYYYDVINLSRVYLAKRDFDVSDISWKFDAQYFIQAAIWKRNVMQCFFSFSYVQLSDS